MRKKTFPVLACTFLSQAISFVSQYAPEAFYQKRAAFLWALGYEAGGTRSQSLVWRHRKRKTNKQEKQKFPKKAFQSYILSTTCSRQGSKTKTPAVDREAKQISRLVFLSRLCGWQFHCWYSDIYYFSDSAISTHVLCSTQCLKFY